MHANWRISINKLQSINVNVKGQRGSGRRAGAGCGCGSSNRDLWCVSWTNAQTEAHRFINITTATTMRSPFNCKCIKINKEMLPGMQQEEVEASSGTRAAALANTLKFIWFASKRQTTLCHMTKATRDNS